MPVRTLSEIAELEKVALSERQLPSSTYAAVKAQAEKTPERPALTFFFDATRYERVHEWSYRQLFAEITRAANAFTRLGLKQDEVVAFILPNLPETHFTIWGGEAAGIAMPINPLLEPRRLATCYAQLMRRLLSRSHQCPAQTYGKSSQASWTLCQTSGPSFGLTSRDMSRRRKAPLPI